MLLLLTKEISAQLLFTFGPENTWHGGSLPYWVKA